MAPKVLAFLCVLVLVSVIVAFFSHLRTKAGKLRGPLILLSFLIASGLYGFVTRIHFEPVYIDERTALIDAWIVIYVLAVSIPLIAVQCMGFVTGGLHRVLAQGNNKSK
ncbi:hypothetical protein [Ruegeria arenilitoris]|uniref:hypothetical protein n=1 Tax=Ruegeria arenilitoris TaxID=1173585 RepID=UPI001CFF2959|nr:hypothetical protein [Ruegeria arenilitoris]